MIPHTYEENSSGQKKKHSAQKVQPVHTVWDAPQNSSSKRPVGEEILKHRPKKCNPYTTCGMLHKTAVLKDLWWRKYSSTARPIMADLWS